jgi:hypothetical protein
MRPACRDIGLTRLAYDRFIRISHYSVPLKYCFIQDLGAPEARARAIQRERERFMLGCGPFDKGEIVGWQVLGGQSTAKHLRDATLKDLCPDVRGSAVIDTLLMRPPSRADTRVKISLA